MLVPKAVKSNNLLINTLITVIRRIFQKICSEIENRETIVRGINRSKKRVDKLYIFVSQEYESTGGVIIKGKNLRGAGIKDVVLLQNDIYKKDKGKFGNTFLSEILTTLKIHRYRLNTAYKRKEFRDPTK